MTIKLNSAYPSLVELTFHRNGRIFYMLILMACLFQNIRAGHQFTYQIDTINPETSNANPPCPSGRDTTLLICPFKGYAPDLLNLLQLPLNGAWEPSLQEPAWQGYYNSCVDSSSVYMYTISVPECPDVQDTVRFSLRWTPPCNWAYEACFTAERYDITIPAYPEFSGNSYHVDFYAAANKGSIFTWTPCGSWTLHPDSTNTISCEPSWNNVDYEIACVDVRIYEPVSGCGWYYPPFDYGYEYWDCNLIQCETVAVETVPPFESINVYPVPTDDVLFIDMENPITEVVISGADGRLYERIMHPASNSIEVADLGPGWYVLRVSDGKHWYFARIAK